MNKREQAIVDCARIAWKRIGDTYAAREMMTSAMEQCIEALVIFERIKELAPDLDWQGLGMMFPDDPRQKDQHNEVEV